jgi:probable F420-dependent oxidoreductase
MAHPRRFRFAAQLGKASEPIGPSWAAQARQAEDLGYSTLLMPDHFDEHLSPVPALVAAALATDRLRVGSLVFDNDYRHPVVLAREMATIDQLSGGRLELSLGAGWMRTDYDQSGIAYDPPAVRVDRFEEGVAVLKGLLETDGPYSFHGQHYRVTEHTCWPRPVQSPRPPLIIGGGGRRVLSIAAREADIVSINVNLREGTGGPETAPNGTPDKTREKVAWVKEAAGPRFDDLELNTLIGFALVTEDRAAILEGMAPVFGVTPEEAAHVPVVLLGTLEEMAEELEWRRAEYGISYYSVEADCWAALGPLVSKLAGT